MPQKQVADDNRVHMTDPLLISLKAKLKALGGGILTLISTLTQRLYGASPPLFWYLWCCSSTTNKINFLRLNPNKKS